MEDRFDQNIDIGKWLLVKNFMFSVWWKTILTSVTLGVVRAQYAPKNVLVKIGIWPKLFKTFFGSHIVSLSSYQDLSFNRSKMWATVFCHWEIILKEGDICNRSFFPQQLEKKVQKCRKWCCFIVTYSLSMLLNLGILSSYNYVDQI